MGQVAGVLDPLGGKLTSNNVAGSSHDPLQSFAVASGAVFKPGSDATGQDALHSAGVEGSEDTGAHSKLPQLFNDRLGYLYVQIIHISHSETFLA